MLNKIPIPIWHCDECTLNVGIRYWLYSFPRSNPRPNEYEANKTALEPTFDPNSSIPFFNLIRSKIMRLKGTSATSVPAQRNTTKIVPFNFSIGRVVVESESCARMKRLGLAKTLKSEFSNHLYVRHVGRRHWKILWRQFLEGSLDTFFCEKGIFIGTNLDAISVTRCSN